MKPFTKILIPINAKIANSSEFHWYLIFLDLTGKTFNIMDSFKGLKLVEKYDTVIVHLKTFFNYACKIDAITKWKATELINVP